MRQKRQLHLLQLILAVCLLGLAGCQTAKTSLPSPSATVTLTPTTTLTFTPTQTTTPAFTITPRPSLTPTITLTPYNTLSPTPTATEVEARPAVLFPFLDNNGKLVDWSYTHVTKIGFDRLDEVNDLWAFLGFQLLDRAIHQRNMTFQGETITVYYLNVAHEFNGESIQMQLVLGGTPGKDVAIDAIPAGGTAYVQAQIQESREGFDPYTTHVVANRPYEYRNEAYPMLFLKDLKAILPTLPDEVILLAEHPILFPRDDWPQIKLDMQRVSYLAARYQLFFDLDAYDRLVGQSNFAYDLRDHILHRQEMPPGFYAFSSQTLIIITGD